MSILNFYDKKRITITSSKTFFKNVLKNDISRCVKKAQKSFKKGYLTMLEEPFPFAPPHISGQSSKPQARHKSHPVQSRTQVLQKNSSGALKFPGARIPVQRAARDSWIQLKLTPVCPDTMLRARCVYEKTSDSSEVSPRSNAAIPVAWTFMSEVLAMPLGNVKRRSRDYDPSLRQCFMAVRRT